MGENDSIGRLQSAALLDNCVSMFQENFKSAPKQYTSGNIVLRNATNDELKNYAATMANGIAADSTQASNYMAFLEKKPFLKVASMELKADQRVASCSYVVFDDNKGQLLKLPYLFAQNITGQPPLLMTNGVYISEVNAMDFSKNLLAKNAGINYYSLTSSNSYRPDNNDGVLSNLNSALNSILFSEKRFQRLAQTTPQDHFNEVDLANYAVRDLYFPDYIPENPIYLTPVINVTHVSLVSDIETSNRANQAMEKFNAERYVDANTGINLYNDTLAELKNEYGIDRSSEKLRQGAVDLNKTVSNAPQTLRLKGDEYFENNADTYAGQ